MMHSSAYRALAIAATVVATSLMVQAATIVKDNNTTNLNADGSWVGGQAPTASDIAQWDGTVTAGQSLSLGGNVSWLGINFTSALGGSVSIASGNTLTLGAGGITNAANRTLTLNNAITLGADQTWTSSTGTFIPAGGVNTGGYTLTVGGSGATQFKGNITGGGSLVVANSNTKFSNGMNAALTDVSIQTGGVLLFDSAYALAGADRMASLTLNGGRLSAVGASNGNELDRITGAITANAGASTIALTPNGSRHLQVESASFARTAGATVLISGSTVGANTLASQTVGSANLKFGGTVALANGVLVGAYGDSGLLTYASDYGVRSLDAAGLYTAGVAGGATSNGLLANSAGLGVVTTTLASDTTVNSLTFRVSGANTAAGSGLALTGAVALKVDSGVIYANQSVTGATGSGNANNAMTINTSTLDLNGKEGILIAYTNSAANSVANGRLEIGSAITNANGLTKSGSGEARLSGATANTYSGTTTVNEGILTLSKPAGVNAIGGHLVINGGRVQHNNSNQIPDTANITINNGTFSLQYSNSGNVHSETFNNLTMNGGTYVTGTANHNGVTNILGTMGLARGSITMSATDDVNVSGLATYSGGIHGISASGSTTAYNTLVKLSGGLAISNTATGAYTPITISGSSTNKGGKLILGGGLTFTGNATNANTVTIDAPASTNLGVIDLDGATRIFNIGNGAAADDLTIKAPIENGGITKIGAGTLVLAGANTYSGTTTVSAGKLVVSGSLASPLSITGTGSLSGTGAVGAVTVGAGGILSPGNSPGTQTFASLTLEDGGAYLWEINSQAGVYGADPGWDKIDIAGTLTLPASGIFNINIAGLAGVGDAPLNSTSWSILSYNTLVGTFDPARFQLNASGLNGTWTGNWAVSNTAGGLQLTYVVPEPASIAALLGMCASCMLIRPRRRA